MIKQPLFSVGEEVILCSKECPELDWEYTVDRILCEGEIYQCRVTNTLCRVTKHEEESHFAYLLSTPLLRDERECPIDEKALRKKYPPSTESFKEMMSRLTRVSGVV